MLLRDIQNFIGGWQSITFGVGRPLPTAKHLKREVDELVRELEQSECAQRKERIASELADVFILTIGVAYHCGVDLFLATMEKMKVNVCRKWQAPDAEGVCEHVREG